MFFLITTLSFAQQKYALVIGNGNYAHITKLDNPVNDANDMGAALQGLGFTVDKVLNGTLDQMESAAIRLKNRLSASKNSYGFLFYAGHGVQSNGENYLIPVDANIQSESFLRQRAVSVQSVLDELNQAENSLNIVVLDACRDNPFSWSRSGSRGLIVVGNQPADSIIVFATSAGSVAADGTGRNGLFTGHLLTHLKTPGLEVTEIFRRTMGDVSRASNNRQRPAVYNQFSGLAYLGSQPSPNTTVQPAPQSAPTVQLIAPPIRPVPDNFVFVEGGTFQMGNPSGGNDNERPVHTVMIKSFSIGKYEVTQKEWQEVMGNNPSNFKGENLPVENVSWYDAIEYCNKRSLKEGLTPAYRGSGDNITCDWNANGYRLPTEAEWEFAAKGGAKNYLTTDYSGSNSVDAVAWYVGNSGERTQPVGMKAANSLGIHDMSGNVWEWCWDWFGSYSSSSQTDPRGAASGDNRVLRGGGWINVASVARSVYRGNRNPSGGGSNNGFRLVRP